MIKVNIVLEKGIARKKAEGASLTVLAELSILEGFIHEIRTDILNEINVEFEVKDEDQR